ncbi:MAG TPA: hypothetical protein VFK48_11150 [Usitatibacter sp.]|nr:hypothetical protein [Usitatibacter sp.]
MNRPKIAALALALAAASTGAAAAAGDRWYGSSRDIVITAPVEVTRVYDEPVILENGRVIYQERIAAPVMERPVIVERDYVVYEPAYRVVPREAYFDPLHPQSGHGIGTGLFNRKGPNDFGS